MRREAEAINEAQNRRKARRPDGEPKVSTEHVLLRDLLHALEVLWEYDEKQLEFSDGSQAADAILVALFSGQLTARVYRDSLGPNVSPIISAESWPNPRPDFYPKLPRMKPTALWRRPCCWEPPSGAAGFWTGELQGDHECSGHEGELPFVPRLEAEAWLVSAGVLRVIEHDSIQERDRAFFAWVAERAETRAPTIPDCEEWGLRNRLKGRHTGRDTIRELRRKLPKNHKRPPGDSSNNTKD